MKRTISVMLGKGSVNHNSRAFTAENVDKERSQYNIEYYNAPIRQVYHELFDDAVKRYNEKQTRNDRRIDDYFEKIRTGKQEKPFKEMIIQVGNKDDMSAISEDGQLATVVLNEFMRSFETRNPQLKVFSAHLHMDEATPHLHIDFIPFTTGSTRGLDTRVSLKKALEAQGFKGGSRGNTEWDQWVLSEKEKLSAIMLEHGIEWEQRGTHREHLSDWNDKKEQRQKEVEALDHTLVDSKKELTKVKAEIKHHEDKQVFIAQNAQHYDDDPEYQLPEPKPLMSAKTYHEKFAAPLFQKLKNVIRSMLSQYFEKVRELTSSLNSAKKQVWNLSDEVKYYEKDNSRLKAIEKDYGRLRRFLGGEQVDDIVTAVKEQEIVAKPARKAVHYER